MIVVITLIRHSLIMSTVVNLMVSMMRLKSIMFMMHLLLVRLIIY